MRVIQVTLLILLVLLIAGLLFSLLRLRRTDYSVLANYMADKSRDGLHMMRPCPLCGTLLSKGERVHTVVFSGPAPGTCKQRQQDRPREALVHMYGCPYCRPGTSRRTPTTATAIAIATTTLAEPSTERICPVCKKRIPEDGYVIARMFTRETRKHVHVLGCTQCRKNRGTQRSQEEQENKGHTHHEGARHHEKHSPHDGTDGTDETGDPARP